MKQGTPLLLVLFWLSLFASPSLSAYITIPEHPTGNCGSWNETFYFWDTNDGSSSSNSINGTVPKGVYNKSDLKQFFCSIDIPALPLGSFCFYLNSRSSSCPFGFTAGTHTQDEEDTNNLSSAGGNSDDLPKLTGYDGSPTWNFCCGSGSPSTVISFDAIRDSLPGNFTLMRRGGSCQMVHGRRNATVGTVFWDDENTGNINGATGAVPDVINATDPNTRIYYCSYGPSFLPRPITALTLAGKSDASAQISWPAPAGASKYRVQLFDGSTSLLNATISTTSYSIPSLHQNKLYTVYVYSGLFDSVTGSDVFETVGVNLQFTTCPLGYTGLSCIPYCTNACVHGDCTGPNFCTCSNGWSGATCNFCGTGFYPSGGSCAPCPSCVAGRGSCYDGPVGSGLCICKPGYTGPLCENCAPGYFADGGDCLPCSSTCYNCTDASTCTFCAAGLALQTDQTCQSGCSDSSTYLNTSTGSCQLCDSNCLTCNGGGSNRCLSCNETRFLHGTTCVDSCPTGTFSDGSGVCRACSFPCNSCEGASGSQCLACSSPYLLRGAQCITPLDCTNLGGFEASGSCQSCDPSCKTCSSPGSSCVSCNPGSYLLNGQCLHECPDTYYANDDLLMCKPCLSPCLTCSSGSSNDCTSCSFPKKLSDTRCVDECPVGLYLNPNINTCTPCSSQCLTCTGPGDSCLVCRNEDYSVLNGACVERCPDKMFSSNRRCQDCFDSCATCSSSSPTGCLTCPSDLLFQQGQCLLNCTSKFYHDTDSRTCLPCQSSCETCSADGCLTCPPERVFEEGQCLFNCTSHFYLDHQTCFPCHSSCETCSTSGPGNCLTCPSDRVWNNGNCISPEACVNLGRFNNSGICTACDESCKTCSGASEEECLSCDSSSFLLNSACLSQCPEGFYGNLAISQCSHCNSVCKTCSSGSNNDCTSCREPLKLSGTTCTSSDCAIGTYYNESTNGCSGCASYCLTCTGPGDSCLLCKDSTLNILDGACVANCPIGKFSLNKRCEDCHLSCKTCSNAASTGCLTCQTDLFFQAGSCLSECSSNYYLGDDNSTCYACHSSCETCSASGALSCLTCPANKVFRDGTCLSLSECTALGGYNNSGICTDCADSCLTCFGGEINQCLSCSAPNFLLDSLCLPQCPIGFYGAQETNQCRACHSSCQSCSSSSANDCLSCKAPLILAGSSCESSCPIATFFNETTNACNECSSNCLTCNNTATYCLTCPKKTVLYLATCVSKCPEGYAASQGECSIEAFKTQRDRTLGGAIGGSIAALFLIVTLAFIFVTYKRRRDKDVIAVISNISMAQLNPKTSLEATQADGNFVARPVSTSRSFVSATDQVTLLNSIIDIALPAFLHLNMTTQVREESPLGSGGASTLFRGRLIDPALIEQHKFENVIVKHIRPIPNAPDEKNAAFFHKEVSINWALNKSSHIVKMVGYSEEPRCIVFKMYEMDMFAMINDPKEKLSPLRAFVLAFQVAKGIQSIHRMNAAHRDLKTKNILIERGMTDDDRDIRAVICDFGLAVYDAEAAIYDPSIEGNEVLKGFSPKYAAPEVFSSPENPDGMTAGYQKVDMYAFAVIVWELVSRRIPWDGYSVDQIKSAVLAGQRPIFPNPEKDIHLNALIPIAEACWSDDPFRRPAIYEIVGKMEAFLE